MRILLSVLLFLTACERPFLDSVSLPEPPNDAKSCAPDAGVATFTATATSDWVALSVTSASSNATGFVLERREHDSIQWGELARLPLSASSFNDFGARPGMRYAYRARTYRVVGSNMCDSPPTDEVIVTTAPTPPFNVSVSGVAATTLRVRWQDVNAFETGFTVEAFTTNGARVGSVDAPADATTADLALALEPATPITLRVFARSAAGSSPYALVATRLPAPPDLAWSDAPTLDDDCRVTSPGAAAVDTSMGATFASATASASAPYSAPRADLQSASAVLDAPDEGPFDLTWSVTDSFGTTSTATLHLQLSLEPVARQLSRRPTARRGDDATPGRQALLSGCGRCDEAPRTQISAGAGHTCFITAQGGVSCFGAGYAGQLGHGSDADALVPEPVCNGSPCTAQLTGVFEVVVGEEHACALLASGRVACFGDNTYGQLGDGTDLERGYPSLVCATGQGPGCEPLEGVAQIALNDGATCARMTDGTVRCWGYNGYGQLGDGDDVSRRTPSLVCKSGVASGDTCVGGAPLEDVTSIALGAYHGCATTSAGNLFCWGYNSYGALGNGTYDSTLHATPVCQSGAGPTCAGGALFTGAVSVAAGYDFSCVHTANGRAWCWGNGDWGQLGDGLGDAVASPTPVCATSGGATCVPLTEVTALAASYAHACAVVGAEKAVVCWGSNSDYQLGSDTYWAVNPEPVCADAACNTLDGVAQVAAGRHSTCARRDDGVVCWGRGSNGRLGNATSDDAPYAAAVCGDDACSAVDDATHLGVGTYTACAVRSGGLWCWGSAYAVLGVGQGDRQATPSPVCKTGRGTSCEPLEDVVQVSAGAAHTCAVTASGNVLCWGYNYEGAVGNGDYRNVHAPTPACVMRSGNICEPLTNVTSVVAGGPSESNVTCAVLDDGTAACWGRNDLGQLGGGFLSDFEPTPQRLVCGGGLEEDCVAGDPLRDVVTIAVGNHHACALIADGRVKCWGDNSRGQLGNATREPSSFPVRVPLQGVRNLAAGGEHTCAILDDGTMKCWGDNSEWQLGYTANTDLQTLPVNVCTSDPGPGCPRLDRVVAISLAAYSTCALRDDGTVHCFGDNHQGVLGDSYWSRRRPPAPACAAPLDESSDDPTCPEPLSGVIAVDMGALHTCVVLEDGSMRCFGDNSGAQLGGFFADVDSGYYAVPYGVPVCPAGGFACSPDQRDRSAAVRTCELARVEVAP